MLYHLLYPLKDIFFAFNIFRYITFRAAGASITAFLISLALGPLVIRLLARFKIGETIRREHVKGIYPLHKQKAGTPTMGGIFILASIIVSCLLWADLTNRYILLVLISITWLGLVGFIDDYIKLMNKNKRGISAATKFAGQILLGILVGIILLFDANIGTRLDIPFFKNLIIDLGAFYILFTTLVIVGASNAVNLTDGLDGLAIGCVSIVALTYGAMSYVAGNIKFANYLFINYIPGTGELSIFCAAMVGAGMGFLWFNAYPASVFMGDVGALALGGAIGVVAACIKKELLLVVVGGIFVIEAFSVLLQVASYKFRRKRIFLMAPLHHHLQMKGWSESKIVVRFWIIAIVLALFSLATLKLR
ncbi:MAG: phospho-N-acetylmuramoyl-pentapeptide-transferase [Candidatus Omnitrophota bacterium]|nr:MAG: phospho-N-acetylmuramoyl-pentapeptide-transferase [Candidatus Omnitrophota bacterium]